MNITSREQKRKRLPKYLYCLFCVEFGTTSANWANKAGNSRGNSLEMKLKQKTKKKCI